MKKICFCLLSLASLNAIAQIKKVGPKVKTEIVKTDTTVRLRGLADTVGFAHLKSQMDVIMQRIDLEQGVKLAALRKVDDISPGDSWRLAITPHDDYAYAGYMYPLVLKNTQARTVVIFGVAHKAKAFGVENQLVFDSYTHWRGPYGNVKVSGLREDILAELPKDMYQINDSLQTAEHSVEAEIPFLQYFNRDVEVVSILVPPMPFSRMNELALPLGKAIAKAFKKRDLEWGVEASLLISTDAVHYGDEDWNGQDFAFFGPDSVGYKQAVEKEHTIIQDCLAGDLKPEKVKKFTQYTVQDNDYHLYKWTWCGRYSVPFGMLTALNVQMAQDSKPLQGIPLDYRTSIDLPPLRVDDLGMGVTAKANIRHWVGYACVGFR
jgi:AmmeMemoRadiSam system protein B